MKDMHTHNLLIRISQFPWVKNTSNKNNFPQTTWGSQVVTGMLNPSLQRDCADGGYADLFDGLRRGGERRNADKKRHETKPSSHPWICVVQNLRVSPKKMRRVGTWIIGPWFQRGYVYSYIMDGNGGNSHIFYFHL